MNPVASLKLSVHDDGVAAIAHSPIALDWLKIPLPQSFLSTTSQIAFSSSLSPIAYPMSVPVQTTAPYSAERSLPVDQQSAIHSQAPLPTQSPHLSYPKLPPNHNTLTKNQAAASLVRHVQPHAKKEVLAPCFSISNRFILGRCLGTLHIPEEFGISGELPGKCTDARFVLDLYFGSVVESRYYALSNLYILIGYTSTKFEYLAFPPFPLGRVEISFCRDFETYPTPSSISSTPFSIPLTQYPLGPLSAPSAFQSLSQAPGVTESLASSEIIPAPQPTVLHSRSQVRFTWKYFCSNYGSFLPSGPLVATVETEPGPATSRSRKEFITVTLNDPYAEMFCFDDNSRSTFGHSRRVAPKRLLPRPT